MKYKVFIPLYWALVAHAASAQTLTPEEVAERYPVHGYAYNAHACYGFAPPEGWFMDAQTAKSLDVGMVFLPDGKNWDNAPLAMYTRIYKGAGEDDAARIQAALDDLKQLYREADNIEITAERIDTLRAEHGAEGELWQLHIPLPGNALREYVTYYPQGDSLALFVIQIGENGDAAAGEAQLRKLADTYHLRSTCQPCAESKSPCTEETGVNTQ